MKIKSKRGFTLIELIVAIAVIGIAAVFAFQLYVTGTKAVTNASTLDTNTQKIVTYFEGKNDGTITDAEKSSQEVTISIKIDGSNTASFKTSAETVTIEDGKTSTSLTHLK